MSVTSGSEGMRDSHAVFNRFWRHYEASMAWMRAHYATVDRLNADYAAQSPRSGDDQTIRRNSPRGPSNSKRRKCHSSARSGHVATSPDQRGGRVTSSNLRSEVGDRKDEDVEDEGSQEEYEACQGGRMDEDGLGAVGDAAEGDAISEEILDFFETSRRHREQRDLEISEKHYENLENLMISSRPCAVNAGEDTSAVFEARQREMKELYGSVAATIHGMEMAMQCGFERFAQADVKLWPNIPMRL